MDALSLYKIIIGILDINTLGAVISTIYIVLKYPLPGGRVGVIRGDQQIAQYSYLSSLEIDREELALVDAHPFEVLNNDFKGLDLRLDA